MLYKYKVFDKQLGVVTGGVEEPTGNIDLAYLGAMENARECGCKEIIEAEVTSVSNEPPQMPLPF